MTKRMTYAEQLKDPRWQKKRLEILQRDNFQCQCCLRYDIELTVHHKGYLNNKNAWEYIDKDLLTLCVKCHDYLHNRFEKESELITWQFFKDVCKTDHLILMSEIGKLKRIEGCCYLHTIIQLIRSYTIKAEEV
jgi:hypothetical protein